MLRVNEALCPLLGRGADELVGRSILDFTHPEDRHRSVEKRESMVDGSAEAALVKRYVRPDGSVVEAIVTIALVEPDVGEPYFFSQLQDVTEQRRAERQKSVIADLGRRALECGDVIVLMGEAMLMVREILGTASCITTRRLASGEVRLVAAEGETFDPTIPPGQPSQTAYTLQVAEPVVSNDLRGEPRFSVPAMIVEHGLHRGLSVPLPERSGARHMIMVHGHAKDRPFTVEDVRFLEAVAHVIAGALDRAESEHELRRRALEDPLTVGLRLRAAGPARLSNDRDHRLRAGLPICRRAVPSDETPTERTGTMAYLQTHFWPGGAEEQYRSMLTAVHPPKGLPEGQTSHVAGPTDGGYLISVVWDSKEHSERFMNGTLLPALPVDGGFAGAPEERVAEVAHLEMA